jgi:hypothetical protein
VTTDGTFTGRFVTGAITDRSVVVMFANDAGDPSEPLVILVDRILDISPA